MMNNQIQDPQMNANLFADKENMQPFVPLAPYALPQIQQQQFLMAPPTWPMPSSYAYPNEQKQFENMFADVQKPSACQAPQMMTNPCGYPFAPMNNQALAPDIANTSGSDVAAGTTSAKDANPPDWKIQIVEARGRLSLLNPQKYEVTRSEIKRRLGQPEHLNESALRGMLRKNHCKELTDDLTKQLAKFEVNLEQGRRKGVQNTVFTTLTEEEAKQVVTDFQNLTDEHFYDKELAYESLARITSIPEHVMKIKQTQCTQMAMQDIFRVLDKAVSPVCDEPTDVKSTLHPKTQEAFDNFSNVTHGFGLPALRVSWNACNRTLDECAKAYADPMTFCCELQQLHSQSTNDDQKPDTVPGLAPPATPTQNTKRNTGAGMEHVKMTPPQIQTNEQD